MKKLSLLLFCSLLTAFIFFACQKEKTNNLPVDKVKIEKDINAWLDNQKVESQPNKKANIQALQDNLDFSTYRFEDVDKETRFLIIPIKKNFITIRHLDNSLFIYLVLTVDTIGNINNGKLVEYTPEKNNVLHETSFSQMVNSQTLDCNGQFQFLSVSGRWLYQFEYKNGKRYSRGWIKQGKSNGLGHRTTDCTDWYLVTTYYYADGTSSQSSVYVGTTCGTCDDPLNASLCQDGGSGGNPPDATIGKLCQGSYNFQNVGNSYTGTVNNLQWNYMSPSGVPYAINYTNTCLSIVNYNINQAEAASIFNNAFNNATDEVLDSLNANLINGAQINTRLKSVIQRNLASAKPGSTWSSAGSCAGYIPVTTISSSSYCP